jgi:hypothetical protein
LVRIDVSWEEEGALFPLANWHLLGIHGPPAVFPSKLYSVATVNKDSEDLFVKHTKLRLRLVASMLVEDSRFK